MTNLSLVLKYANDCLSFCYLHCFDIKKIFGSIISVIWLGTVNNLHWQNKLLLKSDVFSTGASCCITVVSVEYCLLMS
jgi:hypothetical protein